MKTIVLACPFIAKCQRFIYLGLRQFIIISQVPFVSMTCNFKGWYIVYIDNVSLIKNVSVFEILELRHETSQVAASQCEVCGGSVETPTHVVDFWKIDTL